MNQEALKQLWEQSRSGATPTEEEWSLQLKAIYHAGKGLHEMLAFLHQSRPALEVFLEWAQGANAENETCNTDVLTTEALAFFDQNGYLVLNNAISSGACEHAAAAILEHLGVDISRPETWYDLHHLNHGLMVPLYHHAALDENRHSPRIKRAFEQLYATPAIHVVVDKVSYNPPVTDAYRFLGSPLHWDASLAQPIPFKLQGLLYLSDCEAEGGAFHCVPGFHHTIGQWLSALPTGANARQHAVDTLSPVAIAGRAGDLVIWHQALPHCATENRGKNPRLVQYITYDPDDYVAQQVWL